MPDDKEIIYEEIITEGDITYHFICYPDTGQRLEVIWQLVQWALENQVSNV
jgi:hypothetical protein